MRIKRRRYYFSDNSIAFDTVVAFIMGGISLLIELSSIIVAIVTKGNIPGIFTMFYMIAILLSVVGEIFACIGKKAQEGSVKSKKLSILVNILSLVIIVALMIIGLFG